MWPREGAVKPNQTGGFLRISFMLAAGIMDFGQPSPR